MSCVSKLYPHTLCKCLFLALFDKIRSWQFAIDIVYVVGNHFELFLMFCCYFCRLLKLLLEEILSGVVLFPVADKIADPDIINNLIILFCDEEPPPVNPDPPSEIVEFLAHFAGSNSDNQPVSSEYLSSNVTFRAPGDLLVDFLFVCHTNSL